MSSEVASVMEQNNKICNLCNKEKPLTEFVKNKSIKSGYNKFCKSCKNDYENKRLSDPNKRNQRKRRKLMKLAIQCQKWLILERNIVKLLN